MKFITRPHVGRGVVVLVGVLAGIVLSILPGQFLWLNMTTAVLLGPPLAFDAREPQNIRRRRAGPSSRS